MSERDYIVLAAQYQADVLNGTIPACKYVKQACERNRRDLDRQETPDFPYRFDPSAARRICQMAEMLPHIKGPKATIVGRDDDNRAIWNTMQLEPWQCWFLTTMFGWLHQDTGLRRFRVSMLLVPRKNGKSWLAAAIVLYMLTSDGESGAECYSAATTRDQAKVVAELAWFMAKRSPQFCEYFGVRVGAKTTFTLTVPETAGKFAPLSADAHTLDALNVSLAVVDELHAHKTRAVWDVLETATGARPQPLLLITTTAGVEIGGICHEKMSYLHKILEGTVVDESFFGVNFTIDDAPRTDKLTGVTALRELESLCNCNGVSITQIEQFWREAYANFVTTCGTEQSAPRDVRSTQTSRSRPEGCATPATSNGLSITTQILKSGLGNQVRRGRSGTETNARPLISGTEQALRTGNGSSISNGSQSTELPGINTITCAPSRAADAPCVTPIRRDVYTWITATAAEWCGVSFVRSATAQSAFSETLRNVYNAHSPACKARKEATLLDGTLSIERLPDDWRNIDTLQKANPNYGVSVDPGELLGKVTASQHSPAAINNFLTKHLNVWVRSESGWMTATTWQTCAEDGLTLESLKAFPLWIGVDLGETRDPSSLALLFKTGPDTFAFIPRIYMPADVIAHSPIAELSGWVRTDGIIETLGNEADYVRIEDDLLKFFSGFQVQEIDFDKRSARLMMQSLRAKLEPTLGRDRVERTVLDIPQSVDTMDPAMKKTEALVLGKRLRHNGNKAMAWMVGNIVVERDHKGQIYPRKAGGKDSANKIDGAVALFTCLSRAMQPTAAPPSFSLVILGGR